VLARIIVTRYDKQMPKKKSSPVRGRPRTGSALTAAERMRRLRARRKAAGLKPVVAWVADQAQEPVTYSSHRLLEIRSLAMHALIARKIERDPSVLDVARRNVERWRARWKEAPPEWLEEWHELLSQSWQTVASFITGSSERATRLRQSSPFAGVLSNQERWRIHEAFRA
jgi:hypothetical protein